MELMPLVYTRVDEATGLASHPLAIHRYLETCAVDAAGEADAGAGAVVGGAGTGGGASGELEAEAEAKAGEEEVVQGSTDV